MTTSHAANTVEQKLRAQLPMVRLINGYLPLRVTRWLIKQSTTRVTLPVGVTRSSVSADGVPCEWLVPANGAPDKVLLYLHGGGFVLGLTSLHLEMAAYLAQKLGFRVLMVDYRVAPEHPFPAPLQDCVTAYRWLLKQGLSAKNIVIAGDSAGGNFTLTTLMSLRDSGEPLPAAAACLSPVANMEDRGGMFKGEYDAILHPRAAKLYNKSYVADNDPRTPLISPVFGDWRSLPPLLIHCGEDEILCEDAIQVEKLAKAAGVEVRLEIYPRMWHVWQIYLKLPQAIQSLDDIAGFLKSHLTA